MNDMFNGYMWVFIFLKMKDKKSDFISEIICK